MKLIICACAMVLAPFATMDVAKADSPPCAGTELSTATSALKQAHDAVAKTISGLDNSDPIVADKATTWLGVHNSAEAGQIKALLGRALALTGAPLFLCDNSTYKKLGDVYAHVRPTDPFIIKLGAFFWPAPDKGFDSKPGTIVHEATHFSSVGATADLAGDTKSSKSLATTDPAGARRNANSYEYFVESVAFSLAD